MSGNESVLKISGCNEEKDIRLLGYAALLVANLISAPVLASSFTGPGELSRGGAIETSVLSADWSKVVDIEHASRTFVESAGVSAEALKAVRFGTNPRDQHQARIANTSLVSVTSAMWPILASVLLALLGVEPHQRGNHNKPS